MHVAVIVTALVGEIGAVVAKEVAKMLAQDFFNLETNLGHKIAGAVQGKYSYQDLQILEQNQIFSALQKKCVVFAPFDVFAHNKNLFLKTKVFYVFVPKSAVPNFDVAMQIAFDDRDKFLSQYAQKIDFFNFDIKKISSEIVKKIRTKQ